MRTSGIQLRAHTPGTEVLRVGVVQYSGMHLLDNWRWATCQSCLPVTVARSCEGKHCTPELQCYSGY
eukprot:820229-Rhodomonas_salina.1